MPFTLYEVHCTQVLSVESIVYSVLCTEYCVQSLVLRTVYGVLCDM